MEIIGVASGVVLFFTLIALIKPPKGSAAKTFIFGAIALPIITATVYLARSTVKENVAAETGGPVHWHADFRIFSCGEELELKSPTGISNRIGTAEVHEHGDKRIHIEGTLARVEEASLGSFFKALGGKLAIGEMTVPTTEGFTALKDGDACPDGKPGKLRVFLWRTENKMAAQMELADYPAYVISPENFVPPGDCIIFDFASSHKPATDKICLQYEVAARKGDVTIQR